MTAAIPSYVPNPAAETEYVIAGFVAALETLTPPGALSELASLRGRAAELEREQAARARDEPARHNLRYACIVLAGYELLSRRLSDREAVALLSDAFVRSGEWVRDKTRAGLDRSNDPFREVVEISKQREALQFGASFEFERERDDDEAYLLNVRRCFWHDFFVALGRPELTTVLCEFDRNWFDAIVPERHGFRFERTTTLGHGGTRCPFHFVRLRSVKAE